MAKVIIKTSNPIKEYTSCAQPSNNTSLKAGTEIFISNNICGMIIGKPRIAIKAADCCALAAIAAKKVKTRLKLAPPSKVIPKKVYILFIGLPKSKEKRASEMQLITNINNKLKANLDMIKSFAPAIE